MREAVREFNASGVLALRDKRGSSEAGSDKCFLCFRGLCKTNAFSTADRKDLMDDKQPPHVEAESGNYRSFRILGAFDLSRSSVVDQSSLLNSARFLINANNGRVSQVGTRAGSMLYQKLKSHVAIRLPYIAGVLAEETTRGSRQKCYAYEVTLSGLPIEKRASEQLGFQGSYKTTALKMRVEDFYTAMHRGKSRTRGRMTPFTEGNGAKPLSNKADSHTKPFIAKTKPV